MAASVKFNLRAFEEIRRLPGVDLELRRTVADVMAQPHRGTWDGGVEAGATRSRGYVVTADYEAIRDDARSHSLLRAANNAGRT